jgi:regulatory protein
MIGPRRASRPQGRSRGEFATGHDEPVQLSERTPRSDEAAAERERPVRPRGTAKDRALRLLGVRDRTRRELERRLARAGFEAGEIADALEALASAGLIDDERFAGAVVEQARTGRVAGRRAVLSSLLSKGVDRDTAERATESLAVGESDRAHALAARQAVRLHDVDQERAFRRISGLLLRRGFPPGIAYEATRRALGHPQDEDT